MRTSGQWFRFLAACVAVGFMVSTMYASLGVTKEAMRNTVRMSVDFTVLPIVLPDGTEAPAPQATPPADTPEAIEGEATLPPEPTQAAMPKQEPKPEPKPAPKPKPAPAPKPAPKPEPEPKQVLAASGPGTVQSIRLAESQGSFAVTVTADRSVGDTTYMNLNNPRRLVVDLHGKWALHSRNVIRSKGAVKHIVVGEHKDRLRMVIHFNTPPAQRLEPRFERTGKTLKVTIPLP